MEMPETLRHRLRPAGSGGHHGPASCALDDEDLQPSFAASYGLAMDCADLAFCQNYFQTEGRDPTLTEIRMIDTYWSDHCRHTTFLTAIDRVRFDDARWKGPTRAIWKFAPPSGAPPSP